MTSVATLVNSCRRQPGSAYLAITHVGVGRWLDHLSHIEFRILQDRCRDPSSKNQTCSSQPDTVSRRAPSKASSHERGDDDEHQDPISVGSV